MSELKHLNLPELLKARRTTENSIRYHSNKVNGQRVRLEWIDKYIKEKKDDPSLCS